MAYICSPIRGNGVWRSWLAHLVWDQRVLCSSHSTPTKEIKVFDFGLFFMSAHLRAGAVSGTECRRRSKGRGRRSEQRARGPFRALKMRPVRQEAVHSLWSRLFCGPLKMRRVPQEAVFGTEYLFRTVEDCFLHRMPLKMRRVPQEAFLSTARIFRTIGSPLRYRMPDTEASCRCSGAWRTF